MKSNKPLATTLFTMSLLWLSIHQAWANTDTTHNVETQQVQPAELALDEADSQPEIDLTQARPVDRIIAIVNDDIILESELAAKIIQTQQELLARGIKRPPIETLQTKVLEKLIYETLQQQRAQELGLQVHDDEVLAQIKAVAQQNQLSLDEFKDQLNLLQENGFEQFREQTRQQQLIQKLRDKEIISATLVSEDEVNHYLQRQALKNNNYEYHLGHIMINLPNSATPTQRNDAEQKIQKILTQLQTGEDFAQLAIRHSNGSKALDGGDLGWLEREQVPTFFAKAVETLRPNQISDIIRSPVGFHIIKLHDKRAKNGAALKQYHLHRFLLLSDDAKSKTQLPKSIVKLTQKLTSLKQFEKLKADYKDMPTDVNKQTDLGWIPLNKLPPDLSAKIAQLKNNQATAIASPEGWLILFLEEAKMAELDAESAKLEAMNTLKMKKANETFEIWLRRLKEEATIEIRLDENKPTAMQDGF